MARRTLQYGWSLPRIMVGHGPIFDSVMETPGILQRKGSQTDRTPRGFHELPPGGGENDESEGGDSDASELEDWTWWLRKPSGALAFSGTCFRDPSFKIGGRFLKQNHE